MYVGLPWYHSLRYNYFCFFQNRGARISKDVEKPDFDEAKAEYLKYRRF